MLLSRAKKGFTILEAMFLIAAVVLLCVFLVPNIVRWRIARNQSKTIEILKGFAGVLESYRVNSGLNTYPTDLNALRFEPVILLKNKNIIPGTLSFEGSGYWFIYLPRLKERVEAIEGYDVYAMPIVPNVSGINSYVMDEGSTVYVDKGRYPACVDQWDTPVK